MATVVARFAAAAANAVARRAAAFVVVDARLVLADLTEPVEDLLSTDVAEVFVLFAVVGTPFEREPFFTT